MISKRLRERWKLAAVLILILGAVELQMSYFAIMTSTSTSTLPAINVQSLTTSTTATTEAALRLMDLPPLPRATTSNLSSLEVSSSQSIRTTPILDVHPFKNHNLQQHLLPALNDTQLLQLYDAARDPILNFANSIPTTTTTPVRVRVLLFQHQYRPIEFRPGPTNATSDELLNICQDGFQRSPYFELLPSVIVPDFHLEPEFVLKETNQDVVWVVDMRRMVFRHEYSISRQLVHLVNATLHYQQTALESSNNKPKLRIVLMDYRDRIVTKTLCTSGIRKVIAMLGSEPGIVRSVQQQIVRGRYWDADAQFVVPGHVWDNRPDATCFGAAPLHVPYTVRSEYVQAVLEGFSTYLPSSTRRGGRYPPDTHRTTDVSHFWGVSNTTKGHAKLRDHVTLTLQSLAVTRNWTVTADLVSTAATEGRSQVSQAYLKALLTSKIVVVAQRDGWEDHYRFLEAMIGGALVMTDPMITLPEGLVDKESVVVYHSLSELETLLDYYLQHDQERLAIARKGWEIAMTQHRSYHWMEKLFFGRRLTL